jgi:hypothetical protein
LGSHRLRLAIEELPALKVTYRGTFTSSAPI